MPPALLRSSVSFAARFSVAQDQRWLDRLDEEGLAMWEETLGPQVKVENTLDTRTCGGPIRARWESRGVCQERVNQSTVGGFFCWEQSEWLSL